jgi:cell wall-associated NlpC family hydrolase
MKTAKKSAFVSVTLAVIASILMTTAAAEEISPVGPSQTGPAPVVLEAVNDTAAQATPEQTSDAPVPVVGTSEPETASPSPAPVADTTATYTAQATSPGICSDLKSSLIGSVSLPDAVLSAGHAIAEFTTQYDGFKYVYGAASPSRGFDCSGLVHYVYSHFGYSLPRTARAQYKNGEAVDKADLQPGDLVFFATNGGRAISHVGIYIGDGQFIHAATSRQGVIISDIGSTYWAKVLVGARRIVTPQSAVQYVYQLPALSPV